METGNQALVSKNYCLYRLKCEHLHSANKDNIPICLRMLQLMSLKFRRERRKRTEIKMDGKNNVIRTVH